LHFGSLLTALASFLDARAAKGRWLVRVDDVDVPRTDPVHARSILRALEDHDLTWDGEVVYQSNRTHLYGAAFEQLKHDARIFFCRCSRRDLDNHAIYPGTCRDLALRESDRYAARLRVPEIDIEFHDQIQGLFRQRLTKDVGDFVVKRRDGPFAYQLAVVVDDGEQGVTHVVRGADLTDNTPRQLYLHSLLSQPPPSFAHVPVVVDRDGKKLSKHTGATPLDRRTASANLHIALSLLGQNPPDDLVGAPPNVQLRWATSQWNVAAIPSGTKIEHFVCG
jgi:glutamyl-Q tRNA(Asp) synthetase